MKLATASVIIFTPFLGSTALASPVVWTVTGVLASGEAISGSFIYDADTNNYSNMNVISNGGEGPFTLNKPSYVPSTNLSSFIQSPASLNQNGIFMNTATKTNAGGTLAINVGPFSGSGLFTCTDPLCSSPTSVTTGQYFTSGTISGVPATPVPILSQWAMIILGALFAGISLILARLRKPLHLAQ